MQILSDHERNYHSIRPYELLAEAIVQQAIKEYLDILERIIILVTYPDRVKDYTRRYKNLQGTKLSIENFFYSEWYTFLTDFDPDALITQMKKKVKWEEYMNATDLISRSALIKEFMDLPNCPNGHSDTYDKAYIIHIIEDMPAVAAGLSSSMK